MKGELAARFWQKVAKAGPADCWLWTASILSTGYGCFAVDTDARKGAHRVAYELTHGSIPAGMMVCHSCDVRACVNPAHLFLGTYQDNVDDMQLKGRGRWPRGEARFGRKLTEADVRLIKADSRPQKEIAEEFGVSRPLISRIRRGRKWAHVA